MIYSINNNNAWELTARPIDTTTKNHTRLSIGIIGVFTEILEVRTMPKPIWEKYNSIFMTNLNRGVTHNSP